MHILNFLDTFSMGITTIVLLILNVKKVFYIVVIATENTKLLQINLSIM
jgi:hypothetical protein